MDLSPVQEKIRYGFDFDPVLTSSVLTEVIGSPHRDTGAREIRLLGPLVP